MCWIDRRHLAFQLCIQANPRRGPMSTRYVPTWPCPLEELSPPKGPKPPKAQGRELSAKTVGV
jgi:hypothetical protein